MAHCNQLSCLKPRPHLLTQIEVEEFDGGTGYFQLVVVSGLGTSGCSSGIFVFVVLFLIRQKQAKTADDGKKVLSAVFAAGAGA